MWISNPAANPLLYSLGPILVALVAASGTILAVRREPWRGELFRRWRVWVAIVVLYPTALWSGLLPTAVLVLLLVLQGIREYGRLVQLSRGYFTILLVLSGVAVLAATVSTTFFLALPGLLLLLGTLQPLFIRHPDSVRQFGLSALGWGYIACLLSHSLLMYRLIDGGPGLLLAIGGGTALSDVGAFVLGKAIGRHKLVGALSPNKTWEGAIGNLLGAYLGTGLLLAAVPEHLPLIFLVFLPLLIGVGALWGDLMESSIKREFGVKDAGHWLPGFGGLLDRIDSFIIVVPLVFYASYAVQALT